MVSEVHQCCFCTGTLKDIKAPLEQTCTRQDPQLLTPETSLSLQRQVCGGSAEKLWRWVAGRMRACAEAFVLVHWAGQWGCLGRLVGRHWAWGALGRGEQWHLNGLGSAGVRQSKLKGSPLEEQSKPALSSYWLPPI